MVHKHVSNDTRTDGEEMSAVAPASVFALRQPEVGFVDDGGGVEGVPIALRPKASAGDPPKVVIYEGDQAAEGVGLPCRTTVEQASDFRRDRVSEFEARDGVPVRHGWSSLSRTNVKRGENPPSWPPVAATAA
jgi:hypothetical protein